MVCCDLVLLFCGFGCGYFSFGFSFCGCLVGCRFGVGVVGLVGCVCVFVGASFGGCGWFWGGRFVCGCFRLVWGGCFSDLG